METVTAPVASSEWSVPSYATEPDDQGLAQPANQRITIKHPGYGGNNTLIALPARDGIGGCHAHYATVHAACMIVTGNPLDGWLSSSRIGEPRTQPDTEGLVPAGVYFFHLTTDTGIQSEPVAIFPNFRTWPFPHGRIPVFWLQAARNAVSSASPSVALTTETCRITNKSLACETSHIIPTSEKSWFADNEMDQYGELGGRTGQDVADCPSNLLRLRRDLHFLWDHHYFSIVPKQTNKGGGNVSWHAHAMSQDQEVHDDIHNEPTQPLAGRAVEYMYARFAYDIFPKLIGFLQSSQNRRLAVRQPNGDVEVKTYSPQECRRFAEGQGRGRSASPTKRSRKEASDGQADGHEAAHLSRKRSRSSNNSAHECFDSGVSDVSQSGASPCIGTGSVDVDQESRGRKRRRSSSIPTLS